MLPWVLLRGRRAKGGPYRMGVGHGGLLGAGGAEAQAQLGAGGGCSLASTVPQDPHGLCLPCG